MICNKNMASKGGVKMKFNFKIQQYQTDAVDAVVKVFNGQGFYDKINYIRDLGNTEQNLSSQVSFDENEIMDDTGYKNITLSTIQSPYIPKGMTDQMAQQQKYQTDQSVIMEQVKNMMKTNRKDKDNGQTQDGDGE